MQLDVVSERQPTQVGSYFVANYPPFSAWKSEHVGQVQAMLDRRPDGASPPLGLYIHIPFCRKRCKFCYFRVYTDKNASEVDAYMDALAREIALYARRARFAGRQFEFVYFGGGTPSFLSNEQLERLVERINRSWRWDAAREVTFECEPGTLKESKLAAIRQIGVTRLSLGVEHFDDEILEANGRAHRSAEILRAWDWIRAAGFRQVNLDLIAGMVGETEGKWRDAVERALALDPDSVTIYQMELPFNTVFSKEALSGAAAAVASWEQKRAWADYAFRRFEQSGYRVSSGYTLTRASDATGFVYRDALWRGADMVGTGVASFSQVGGVHFQNHDKWESYVAAIDRGELPLSRALSASPHQLLVRELVLQLKLGAIDTAYFRAKFGIEPRETFAQAWRGLLERTLAVESGPDLLLTRAGLLQVDALLPEFFEPQFRGVRYT